MKVNQLIVNINSETPEALIAFYRDVLGLASSFDIAPGAFSVGSSMFIIEAHQEIKGTAKEPQRVLLNFAVDDLAAEQKRLEALSVRFVGSSEEPGVGVFSTFLDPDGNYCQLVEFRE